MFKNLFLRFKSSEFLVNITKLTTGTAIAQFISISTAPVLYRIYDKEQYGSLGLYMAITGVMGVFSTMQYLQTILLEKDDESAINAMWLNRGINTGFAILILLLLFFLNTFFVQFINNPLINLWLWFLPISVFFAGQNEIFRMWANRKKEYNLLTFNAIFMAILTPCISILLGIVIPNETGLFMGLIVGQSLPAIILFLGLRKKYQLGLSNVTIKKIKLIAFQNNQLLFYSLPSEFINRLTNQLPVFMLNSFIGPASVALYNLSMRMLGLPIQFIGGAISAVFQQRATEDYNNTGNCRVIFIKTLKILTLIAILPALVVVLFGPNLFAVFFGAEWRDAGNYAQILVFMFCGKLIVSPLTYLFFIAKKQKEDFFWHIWMLVSNTLIFYLLFKLELMIQNVLLAFSLNYSLIYLLYLFRSYQFTDSKKLDFE
jgi:O-antigen/teichoic acid export membrane protein